MLYRPYEGFGIDETTLVHALHDLAKTIAMAKRTGQVQAARMLYDQFVGLAEQYRRQGGSERAVLDLINRVHDAVIGTVEEVAGTVGSTAAAALSPLKGFLLPLALVAGVLLLGPALATRIRRR